MKLAIHQTAGSPGEVASNLDLLERSTARAAAEGASLLLLPELFLTGYNIGDRVHALAEPLDGPSLSRARTLARQHGVALAFGFAERAPDGVYNSAALIDAQGELLGSYRKTHLFGPEEKRLFRPGSGWLTADIGSWRVGCLICFDVEFPEAVRALALAGVELVLVPTANSPPYFGVTEFLVRARAYENHCYVAYVNRIGEEAGLSFYGESCVAGPDGGFLVREGTREAFRVVELRHSAIEREKRAYDYLRERRRDLYSG